MVRVCEDAIPTFRSDRQLGRLPIRFGGFAVAGRCHDDMPRSRSEPKFADGSGGTAADSRLCGVECGPEMGINSRATDNGTVPQLRESGDLQN